LSRVKTGRSRIRLEIEIEIGLEFNQSEERKPISSLPEINIESVKKFEYVKTRKNDCLYKKNHKFFLHINGQKFNSILVSCCTLEEKIVY